MYWDAFLLLLSTSTATEIHITTASRWKKKTSFLWIFRIVNNYTLPFSLYEHKAVSIYALQSHFLPSDDSLTLFFFCCYLLMLLLHKDQTVFIRIFVDVIHYAMDETRDKRNENWMNVEKWGEKRKELRKMKCFCSQIPNSTNHKNAHFMIKNAIDVPEPLPKIGLMRNKTTIVVVFVQCAYQT